MRQTSSANRRNAPGRQAVPSKKRRLPRSVEIGLVVAAVAALAVVALMFASPMHITKADRQARQAATATPRLPDPATVKGIEATKNGCTAWPLCVKPANRTQSETTQARLMLPVYLAKTGLLAPVPSGITVPLKPTDVAEIELTLSDPSLDWTTGPTQEQNIISVSSAKSGSWTAATVDVQDDVYTAASCWYVHYDSGRTPTYGTTSLPAGGKCNAATQPESGWQPSWPSSIQAKN